MIGLKRPRRREVGVVEVVDYTLQRMTKLIDK